MKKGSVGRVLEANRALLPRKTGLSRPGVSVAVEGERRLRFTVFCVLQVSVGGPGLREPRDHVGRAARLTFAFRCMFHANTDRPEGSIEGK